MVVRQADWQEEEGEKTVFLSLPRKIEWEGAKNMLIDAQG